MGYYESSLARQFRDNQGNLMKKSNLRLSCLATTMTFALPAIAAGKLDGERLSVSLGMFITDSDPETQLDETTTKCL